MIGRAIYLFMVWPFVYLVLKPIWFVLGWPTHKIFGIHTMKYLDTISVSDGGDVVRREFKYCKFCEQVDERKSFLLSDKEDKVTKSWRSGKGSRASTLKFCDEQRVLNTAVASLLTEDEYKAASKRLSENKYK